MPVTMHIIRTASSSSNIPHASVRPEASFPIAIQVPPVYTAPFLRMATARKRQIRKEVPVNKEEIQATIF